MGRYLGALEGDRAVAAHYGKLGHGRQKDEICRNGCHPPEKARVALNMKFPMQFQCLTVFQGERVHAQRQRVGRCRRELLQTCATIPVTAVPEGMTVTPS